jgi:integrase
MAHGSVDGAAMAETCAGARRVLPDDLGTILSEHVAAHLPDKDPGRWLFTVGDDPMYDNAITWRWRATRTSAGRGHVRLHDLRHFYASGLIAAGCDVVTVQRALGHSTATTTLNTYSHLWPTAEDRTRKAAAGLMRQALEVTRRPDRESRQRRLAETGSTR